MKLLPRLYHAFFDYALGAFLIASPHLFGFAFIGGAVSWVSRVLGIMLLLQAMLTDYELGLVPMLLIATHLLADFLVGGILIAAPWVFAFNENVPATLTHVIGGLAVIFLTTMTQIRGRPRRALV